MDIFLITFDEKKLPPKYSPEKKNIKFWQHKLSVCFAKSILEGFYSIDADILYDNKRPYLKGNQKFFTVSHSNNFVALAFDNHPCGIDIEQIKMRNFSKVLAYLGLNEPQDISKERFYQIWTTYESEFKLKCTEKSLNSLSENFINFSFVYNNNVCTVSSSGNFETNCFLINPDSAGLSTISPEVLLPYMSKNILKSNAVFDFEKHIFKTTEILPKLDIKISK